jgi:hypothetical protein
VAIKKTENGAMILAQFAFRKDIKAITRSPISDNKAAQPFQQPTAPTGNIHGVIMGRYFETK